MSRGYHPHSSQCYYHWVDTSAGGLYVPRVSSTPVVSTSALTLFIRYLCTDTMSCYSQVGFYVHGTWHLLPRVGLIYIPSSDRFIYFINLAQSMKAFSTGVAQRTEKLYKISIHLGSTGEELISLYNKILIKSFTI